MESRTIKVLHVEDEESQRRLLAHHLKEMNEFQFDIHYAATEESALVVFQTGGVEFVILDYHLQQGNGLRCLKELRSRDQVVPIIAISGVATEEIATDLIQAGADEYLNKQILTSSMLARSMREILKRIDGWRRWSDSQPD